VVCLCDTEYSQSAVGTHSANDAIIFESADIPYSLLDFQKVPLLPFVPRFRERFRERQQVVMV
jgi:hypothetical protein